MNYLQREQNKQRWFLLSPAFLFLIIGASGPLLIVIAYSFLKPGDYGGVIWEFSLNAWIEVILQEDIFDETLGWADAHLVIFWRSIKLSVITTILTLIMGVPLGYFIATRPGIWKEVSLFLITLPFWTNLLVRTFAVQELIRNQDDEFNYRMIQNDFKIWLHPSIKSFYYTRNTLLGLVKQYFQYGF